MTKQKTVLGIDTTRYSAVVGRILTDYQNESSVKIDGRVYVGSEIDDLLREWCTNRNITSTINFEVTRDDVSIFGFHDHPDELWAAASEEEYVASLASEGLLRFRRMAWVPCPRWIELIRRGLRQLFSRTK
jgi:hypothetical protein